MQRYDFIHLTEDENLVFRGNSFATKAMDSYMKMIGESVSQQRFLVFENYCYFFPMSWPLALNKFIRTSFGGGLTLRRWLEVDF